jgi:hypothetical protein
MAWGTCSLRVLRSILFSEASVLSNNGAITTDEGRRTKDEARCRRFVFRLPSFVEDGTALI